jgi:DNA-binding transcriptional ArsR family regulator
MTTLDHSDDDALLEALRHPLRRQILRRMREGETLSPSELAEGLDAPLSRVSYHVRVLAKCRAVTLVRTRPARGAIQHFYRTEVDTPWARQILDQLDRELDAESAGESRDRKAP